MRKRPKERVERRKLADGTVKTYRYAAKTAKPSDAKTVSSLLAAWQRSPEWGKLAGNTATSYTRYLGPFFEAYRGIEIKNVKRRHLLGVRDDLAKERGHGAAAAFCKAVSSFYNWLEDREYVEVSPATRLLGPLTRGTLPTWTLDQALKAEAELPRPYARAVFLARHIVQRRGDICALKWKDYDGKTITLTQEKTGSEMVIPVNPELKRALDAWKSEPLAGLTILTGATGAPLKKNVLSVRLPIEAQRIGLPKGLNIHGLRKLALVSMAEAGCTTHEMQAMSGHKTLGQLEVYTRAADQRTLSEAAVIRLENHKHPKTSKNRRYSND